MIARVVKMTFRAECVNDFLTMFESVKHDIRAFPGCRSLSLLQTTDTSHVMFTYSRWDDETALQRYRTSDLFRKTWWQTKQWFDAPAEAWSANELESL